MPSLANRSSIFGTTSSSQGTNYGRYTWPTNPSTADMFKFLKWTADQNLEYLRAAAEWMGSAASQGQNGPNGFVNTQHLKPTAVSAATANAQWTFTPAYPTLPAMPTLPPEMKVDFAKARTDFAADLAALQSSWITKFLPASPTEVDSLNSMLTKVLDGTFYTSSQNKMNALETELKNALSTATTAIKSSMASSITALNADMTSRTSTIDAKLAAQLAIATDNTQNIAWSRARDQAVAEAVRVESEAATLWASRGFILPPGVLTMQALATGQASTNASIAAAAEQAVRSQQLYFDVASKGVDAWLSATQLVVGTQLENYKAEYAQRLAVMQAETDQNRAKVKQAFDHIGLSLDFSKFAGDTAMRYRLGVNSAVSQLVTAYGSLLKDELEFSVQAASAQRQFLSALVDYYRAAIQSAELSMKGAFNNSANDLKYAEISAGFINAAVSNHVRAAAETGNMYAQAASYALNGMTGIATKSESDG